MRRFACCRSPAGIIVLAAVAAGGIPGRGVIGGRGFLEAGARGAVVSGAGFAPRGGTQAGGGTGAGG
ncbi:MAG TPA: hypothetical protein VH478_21225, partial [Trebonia sp.]|nr:hypothetical protein [Trebonia sp.]